ncbi:puromycin-sensitive aminopeptidase-like [Mizuhopecten yessoensis]|uniref:puromycin-sensitive aminopeptidase-like n=1 Tax=Mizuhopecten yessoensis TaxID=6573 RepID=UPI000B45B5A9|nr:puromycin-sensitive aminopeptidase-like [Mizuhopecten yessoensis]
MKWLFSLSIGIYRSSGLSVITYNSFQASYPSSIQSIYCGVTKSLFGTYRHQSISPSSSTVTVFCRNFRVGMPDKKPFQRLPLDACPVNYSIRLQPNLKSFTFDGLEDIQLKVKKSLTSITLNCCDIDVKEASYQADGSADKIKGEISYTKEDEIVKFSFPSEIQPGNGTLSVSFDGELNDKMKGFYRSKYTSPDGEERIGAVTQFEATDARRAFPCWDEPAVKATFDVTLVVPNDRVALSNMPVKSESPLGGDTKWKVMTYERTPVMPTYLLAFVVGEYDFVEARDADGVLIRVYTPVGKKEQGQFALDVAVKTLPFYNKYFKIAYPLPKMDLIAIADFAAGAMENWGLVTYRETALLIDPTTSSAKTCQWVALVVGHELAHQWFGNLVTMEWWTHLWLNEGFASWIEYLCVDHCFPEFDIWTQFVNQDLGRALELDALHNSHPIEVAVGHPDEVDEIFDAISYSKGASVIRMLHDYIGDEDFRKGMNQYLTKFQYSNAFTEDLWDALGKASGKPVKDIMSTWTQQMGFPVIKVEEKQEGNSRILTLTQEKFCADGQLPEGCTSKWLTPISICSSSSPGSPVKRILMEDKTTTVTLENVKPGDWVKLNGGTVGVYRVQYTPATLEAMIPAVRDRTISPRDRLGPQSDLFALARAGMVSSVDAFKVSSAFVNENNYTVWVDLSMNLGGQGMLLQYTDAEQAYKTFCLNLFKNVYQTIGWEAKEGESPLNAMLRDLVLSKMGRCGDSDVVAEANRRFEAHVSGTTLLSANLRSPVYITVLSNGNEETYNKMLQLYDAADMQEEKVRISRSLGCIKSPEIKKKVLKFAMSEKVRSQDTVFVIAGITGSVEGREIAWQFLQDNWAALHDRYKGGFLLSRLVKTTTENFVTEERAKDIEKFFEEHSAPAAERTIQQSCENIRLNAKWIQRDSVKVSEFLKNSK